MADSTERDETPDERERAAETGATPEEAHREGEFDALSEKLDAISEGIAGLMTAIGALATAPSHGSDPEPSDDDELSDYDRAKLIPLDELDI